MKKFKALILSKNETFDGGGDFDNLERLSRNLLPILYDLKLKIFLPFRPNITFDDRNFTIDGEAKLNFRCLNSTNILKLHAKELDIDYSKIQLNNGIKRLNFRSITYNDNSNLLELRPNIKFKEGFNYTIKIYYKALINKHIDGGLFSISYLTKKNEKRYFLIRELF